MRTLLALLLLIGTANAADELAKEPTFEQAVCQGFGEAARQFGERRNTLSAVVANVRIEIASLLLQEVDNIVFSPLDPSAVPSSKGPVDCRSKK